MVCWLKNWLNSRAQRVAVNGAASDWQLVFLRAQSEGQLSTIWMKDLDAPLASLLLILNWEVVLTHLKDKWPCRGT